MYLIVESLIQYTKRELRSVYIIKSTRLRDWTLLNRVNNILGIQIKIVKDIRITGVYVSSRNRSDIFFKALNHFSFLKR